jgi:hypothetical protein
VGKYGGRLPFPLAILTLALALLAVAALCLILH